MGKGKHRIGGEVDIEARVANGSNEVVSKAAESVLGASRVAVSSPL